MFSKEADKPIEQCSLLEGPACTKAISRNIEQKLKISKKSIILSQTEVEGYSAEVCV